MIEVLPDLFVLPANERAGFGYSHFARRPSGNVLLPRLKQASMSASFAALEAAGGIDWVLVSDRHFGGPGCREVADHFGATLVASAVEAKAIARRCRVDLKLALAAQTITDTDLMAIPTPGHTAGQLAYLFEVGSQRLLFGGDFAYREQARWRVGNKRRQVMQQGMALLHEQPFDVYVGCAGYDDEHSTVRTNGGGIAALRSEILAACTKP